MLGSSRFGMECDTRCGRVRAAPVLSHPGRSTAEHFRAPTLLAPLEHARRIEHNALVADATAERKQVASSSLFQSADSFRPIRRWQRQNPRRRTYDGSGKEFFQFTPWLMACAVRCNDVLG